MTQRQELSQCCLKNGAKQLAEHGVTTNLQFVKKAVSVTHVKWSAIRPGMLVL